MGEGSHLVAPLGTLALPSGLGELDFLVARPCRQPPGTLLVVVVVWEGSTVAPPTSTLVIRGRHVREVGIGLGVVLALLFWALSVPIRPVGDAAHPSTRLGTIGF